LYYRAILDCDFLVEIEQAYGKHFVDLADLEIRRFTPAIIEDLQEDNRLSAEYQKILATCQVDFMGETRNLYGLTKFLQHPDRAIRRDAYLAWAGFFSQNEEKLDDLFDRLVRIRTSMALKMGFENYVEMGYLHMGRLDYGQKEVAAYRQQVRDVIVPLCTQLYQRQQQRIGVDSLKYYDEAFQFTTGNPTPKGDTPFMLTAAQNMYDAISPDTGAFFRMMTDRKLLELESKPNKAVGGYCDFLPKWSAPFIFSNFNGTAADVDVLTHECGHAFMAYLSHQENTLPEYLFGSSETNEIHSMSMEFFAYPHMHLFFDEQADKYRFSHMADALLFIPYGVAVDEFQHIVYANPDMTPADRKRAWQELERVYLPHRDYDGVSPMANGGFWQKQLHIFMHPFYYIDYTLASISAFEFYGKMEADRAAAWWDYVALCKLGGSQSYLALLKRVHLKSPFEPGTVQSILAPIRAVLEHTDDLALDR
ncbi:M3 family oligoendopeptidase, partial [Eubacteriales bacterium OttesenSCG-928-M02]|nr:M3 family oligoendopeptidase [Eubacteriales bacterium OttesenSCG-928-M02]